MRPLSVSDEILAALSRDLGLGVPLLLGSTAAARILSRCTAGRIAVEDVVQWAQAIELCEDVKYEPGRERAIADVLFELATPEINGALTVAKLAELVGRLRKT